MAEFNNMALVAAAEVLARSMKHSDLGLLELEWGLQGRCSQTSLNARITDLARIAIEENIPVMTVAGQMPLQRALIIRALSSAPGNRERVEWIKLVAGLRLDGFEVCEEAHPTGKTSLFDEQEVRITLVLRRMLPEDIPQMGSRAAQSELTTMLVDHGFVVSKGHLDQAIAAFSRGDWAAANSQLRTLFEDCLNEIALRLGCDKASDTADRRRFLGEVDPPFLLQDYNEWFPNIQKPQYVQGLWQRLHQQGSHPGLSEEDDCTFRMQIVLVSVRLFMRRFIQRTNP